jgi:hypothetical protein
VQPWNARDTSIADPDGYHLTFSFWRVDAELTFEEVGEQLGLSGGLLERDGHRVLRE